VKEREKIVLSAIVKYWCIHHYHKCKVEYTNWIKSDEISISYNYNWKKKMNVALKSETSRLLGDNFFANDYVILERRE